MNLEVKTYTYKEASTGRMVVKAVTLYEGKPVYAYAKCDTADTFDEKFGVDVATLRLHDKILLKKAKGFKRRAKYCEQNIQWCKDEIKRLEKVKTNAEVAALDRLVEAKEIESHIKDILETI